MDKDARIAALEAKLANKEAQLTDANNRLRDAWVENTDLKIDIERLETTMKHQRLYAK